MNEKYFFLFHRKASPAKILERIFFTHTPEMKSKYSAEIEENVFHVLLYLDWKIECCSSNFIEAILIYIGNPSWPKITLTM
jgi:hypothetical protein